MLVTRDGAPLKEISLEDITGPSQEETRILKRCPFPYSDGREEKCANCNKLKQIKKIKIML